MKNLKVKSKLFVSFTMVVALAIAVGIVGIVGMTQIDDRAEFMYADVTAPLPYLARIQETLQHARVQVREMVLASYRDDMGEVEAAMGRIGELVEIQAYQIESYSASLTPGGERAVLFDKANKTYNDDLVPTVLAIYAASQVSDFDEIAVRMETCRILSDEILEAYDTILNLTVTRAEEAAAQVNSTLNTSLALIIGVLIVVVGFTLVLIQYVSNLISKPLGFMARALEQVGSEGDLEIPPDITKNIQDCSAWKDEIGICTRSFSVLIESLTGIENNLKELASGNLEIDIKVASNKDNIGISMKKTIDSLNDMFKEISVSSVQVTSGANQIADGAGLLASGATQQAATLQEISASISDIADKTQENTERTANASDLANRIMQDAEKGSSQMEQMIAAVNEINQANQNISKVIKVIDDIAFQTNILALNAAVEAARAGAAGKGFAVVAEEVRNLAAKSAESAKDTSSLIENSMTKAQLGTQIAAETAESLNGIVTGIEKSNRIIAEIAASSEEQNTAIGHINISVGGVTSVVQQNSATAEESAAASQEMSSQATILQSLTSQFRLR